MANTITKSQRAVIYQRAANMIDAGETKPGVIQKLMDLYGISHDRATWAVAQAIMRNNGKVVSARGGYRPGSGAPKKENPGQRINIYLYPHQIEWLHDHGGSAKLQEMIEAEISKNPS
jgi:hypothetical protein